jgi:hypothetical protein
MLPVLFVYMMMFLLSLWTFISWLDILRAGARFRGYPEVYRVRDVDRRVFGRKGAKRAHV